MKILIADYTYLVTMMKFFILLSVLNLSIYQQAQVEVQKNRHFH